MGFPRAIAEAQRKAVSDRIAGARADVEAIAGALGEAQPHLVAMSGDRFASLRRQLAAARDALEQAHALAANTNDRR